MEKQFYLEPLKLSQVTPFITTTVGLRNLFFSNSARSEEAAQGRSEK